MDCAPGPRFQNTYTCKPPERVLEVTGSQMTAQITIRGARLHNLKNVTPTIPKNQLVVLTGVSGSGKSTLGFDILLKEGQRQYMESLGLVAFGLAKPPVDAITGLSPSIGVDQHLTNRSPRSTVGTVTEVYTYLRVVCSPGTPPLPDLWKRRPALLRLFPGTNPCRVTCRPGQGCRRSHVSLRAGGTQGERGMGK